MVWVYKMIKLEQAGPTTERQRHVILDALRGLALYAIGGLLLTLFVGLKYHDDDAMMLISDTEICDPAMLRYLLQHHMLPDTSFNDDPKDKESLQLAQDNLDFIARTVRRHFY